MQIGAHVTVKFGEWDTEVGIMYGVTKLGNLEIAFILERGSPGEVIIIECSPFDVDEYRA